MPGQYFNKQLENLKSENTTPLRNLFAYIRDLYNAVEPVLEFEKEPQNPKIINSTYWTLEKLLELCESAKQKSVADFQLQINIPAEPILKIKRIIIPSEPKIPDELSEWIVISKSTDQIPALNKKDTIKRENVIFGNSPKRVKEFDNFKQKCQKYSGQKSLFNDIVDIKIPAILKSWITVKQINGELLVSKIDFGTEVEEFEDNQERGNLFNQFQKDFNNYYETYWISIKINKVYDALHTLNYDLKGRDNKKLYISFGLLSGKIGGKTYKNFLFNIPLKISLRNQEIKIEFDTFANKIFCEQFFTELLDNHFINESSTIIEQKKKEVLETIDQFNSKPGEFLFEKDFIRENYHDTSLKILSIFPNKLNIFFKGEALNFEFYPNIDNNLITFSFSPVVQTKVIESQIFVSKDASNIIKKIDELESIGSMNKIPDYFKKLFYIPDSQTTQNGQTDAYGNISSEILKGEASNLSSTHNIKFLFPLAYNQEQFEIARRLVDQDAVTVKGPPGTGKSHTIANLISHFVAQGKSILVVSRNAKALTVLKDKLPDEIKKLAISLVDESSKKREDLKNSVNSILYHLNKRYDERELKQLEEDLNNLEIKYAHTLEKIYQAIQLNNKTLKLLNHEIELEEEKTAYEWATFFFNNKPTAASIIVDNIRYDLNTTGISDNVLTFVRSANGFSEADFNLINYTFQSDDVFFDINEFRKIENRLSEILQIINPYEYENVDYKQIDKTIHSTVDLFLQKLDKLSTSAIANQLIRHSNFNAALLKNIIDSHEDSRDKVTLCHNRLLAYRLETSAIDGIEPDILDQNINKLIIRYGKNRTLGPFKRTFLGSEFKKFFECKINYIAVSEIDHIKILETYITKKYHLKRLNITFSNYLRDFGIQINTEIHKSLKELDFVIEFLETLENLNRVLINKNLLTLDYKSADFQQKLDYLVKLKLYAEYKNILNQIENKKSTIQKHANPHPLCIKIIDAIDKIDRVNYENYLNQYKTMRTKSIDSHKVNQIYEKIYALAPHTAKKIKQSIIERQNLNITKPQIETDIFYLKIEHFLNTITKQTAGTENLFAELHILKANKETKTAELIAYKTWYYKNKQVDNKQKSSLNAWLNDLINIGKAYGKNTARNIHSAIQNMQIAKRAVPIWIMRQEAAITFFPDTTPGQFDLLIIDEASQCDISSLNLIFRCKKSVIVGDENQTSVAIDSNVFPIDRTNNLLDRYLINHPHKQQFNVNNKNNSVYSLSGVIYPNIVTLLEHFRCLPEIIGFSNYYVYNNDMIPLKTATEKTFGEPLELHYIEDLWEDESKPKIVEKTVRMIEDYVRQYVAGNLKRLPSVGILALDSSNVKHQHLLMKQISSNEHIKQYEDKLDLLIGTSREFQGDERDVMILTSTASHSINEKFEIKPPRAVTAEEYMRIYNVAASRAKEKSILLHSIHPDAIGLMNPDCYRKKLIDYYANIHNTPQVNSRNLEALLNMVDPLSEDFEKTVCKFLYDQGVGNFLTPQCKVGKYKIDFGIIKNSKKIAIECDGSKSHSGLDKIREDIDRQLILERAGWRFFRLQSTEWFYKNEKVSRRLLEWINENTK